MSTFDNASLVFIPSGYKTSKAYSVKPSDGSGDLAFSRSNDTATRVNSAGLIEKVRTNLALYSQDFTNPAWYKEIGNSATANTIANPLNGAVDADTITATATNAINVNQLFTAAVTSEYTYSIYLKKNNHDLIQPYIFSGGGFSARIEINLNDGTFTTINGSGATVTSVGNGWYRVTLIASFSSTNTFTTGILTLSTTGSRSVYVFGAQTETGVATDYIATTSAAVSVGPVANVPRLDYLNSSCPRLLLEPQRTNLLTYSEQFNNAAYALNNATITANSVVSPDGYTNADTYTATGGGNYINGNATSTGSNTITYSVFAKAGTQNVFRIREANYFGSATIFNLSTGTVTSGTGTITSYGNGWYRCTHTQAYGAGQVIVSAIFDTTASSGTFYLYGAQFEVGAYATSYIPTLGAAVTRGADACSKTGISSLIGQTEGTLFVEFDFNGNYDVNGIVAIDVLGAGNNEAYIFITGAGQLRLELYAAGAVQGQIISSIGAIGRKKIAFAYKANDFVGYMNGVQVGTDTSGIVGTMDTIYVGTYQSPTYATGNMNQTLLFKTRLSNADLAALTTI